MALTLKDAITATQTTIDVNGLDTLTNGDMYSLDDEYVLINTADPRAIQPGETAYQRVSLDRGVLGTRKAAHAAAATLTAVNIASGGGGSGVTVDNTVDAPFPASTLIVPGTTESGVGEATFPPQREIHVETTGAEDAEISLLTSSEDGSSSITIDVQSLTSASTLILRAGSGDTGTQISISATDGLGSQMDFGFAPTDRIGFYGTPATVQPAAIADATDPASTMAAVNLILAAFRAEGLIAT